MKFMFNPPALVITRAPGDLRWAKQRGPVMILPHNPPAHLIAHEAVHVRQWYAFTVAAAALLASMVVFWGLPWQVIGLAPGLQGVLMAALPGLRFALEAAAYAATVRQAPQRLERSAKALATGYGLQGVSIAAARQAIKDRV